MALTIDCGEGRHAPTCRGEGDQPYLIPQEAGTTFTCSCWCHRVTKTGKVLTDADIEALADEAEAGYDVEHLRAAPSRRRRP